MADWAEISDATICGQAAVVVELHQRCAALTKERDELRSLVNALAERVAICSELLGRAAEKKGAST